MKLTKNGNISNAARSFWAIISEICNGHSEMLFFLEGFRMLAKSVFQLIAREFTRRRYNKIRARGDYNRRCPISLLSGERC